MCDYGTALKLGRYACWAPAAVVAASTGVVHEFFVAR